jgi:hypothetical protein
VVRRLAIGPRQIGFWMLLLTSLLAICLPAQAARRFSGYVACSVSDSSFRSPPRHTCYGGDVPYAVFTDRRRSFTRYRKCITVPGGQTYCARHRTGRAGLRHQRPISAGAVGQYTVRWYVAGRLVRDWSFRYAPEND